MDNTASIAQYTAGFNALSTRVGAIDLTDCQTDVTNLETQRDAALAYITRMDTIVTDMLAINDLNGRATILEGTMAQLKCDVPPNT